MKILPVIDLLDGVVVRGVAGQRENYRPVESCLVDSAVPLEVARVFRDALGLNQIYVADLDGILHGRPHLTLYESLAADGFELLVDAGLRELKQAADVLSSGASSVIAGLETIPGPELLHAACDEFGAERVVFSLDLKGGVPLGNTAAWGTSEAFAQGMRAIDAGVRRMIVLDLAQVGVGAGVSTGELCGRLRREYPELELITGGGVRDAGDLQRLQRCEVDAALVASALHDGRIGREEIVSVAD